jgi:hypothetical protein
VKHVAPERWAELARGQLDAAARVELEAHAASCLACRAERARVESALAAMDVIADADAPELAWDALDARMHWIASSQSRRVTHVGSPRPAWRRPLFIGLFACAAAALWLGVRPAHAPSRPTANLTPPAPARPAPLAPAPAPAAPLEGVVTLAAGAATLDGAPLVADAVVHAGSRLVTGDGTVHVQFGEHSGFVLEPRSVLELVAFDDGIVELRVEGAVGVEIAHRAPGQRFAVVAAGRRVEVRGTIFRVQSGAAGLDVACTRGRVAVLDGHDAVEVPAGSALSVPLAAALTSVKPRLLADPEVQAAAAELGIVMVAGWRDAPGVRAGSGTVRVTPPRGSLVEVDGVTVARGDGAELLVRVAPGRHQLAIAGRARWVEVETGAVVQVETPSGGKISERAAQVEAELARHRARFETCANRARNLDPSFKAELTVEIDIGADGSVRAVVPVKGLADPATEKCLLDVIREQFTFPAGSADTVSKKIRL